jgi:hypothetical protein
MTISGIALTALELGATRCGALVAALVTLAMPLTLVGLVGTNIEDLYLAGALALACGFAARAWRTPGWGNVVAVGLATGIGVGSRYAGLTAMVAPVALLLAAPWARAGGLRAARALAVIAVGAVATGGYWYIRNLVYTGDPVYPASLPWHPVQAVEQLGLTPLRSYLGLGFRPADWLAVAGRVTQYFGPLYVFLVAAMVGLAIPGVKAFRGRRLWALLPLAELVAFLALPTSAGTLTHGHIDTVLAAINARYLVPGLGVTAAVLVAALARWDAAREPVAVAALALVAAATTPVFLALYRPDPGRELGLGSHAAGAAVLVAGFVVLRPRGRMRFAATALLLAGAVAGAGALADHYDGERLNAQVPYEDAAARLTAGAGAVDVVGICRLFAFYGPKLDRRVLYLTGDDGVVDRPLGTSSTAWLAALRANHVTHVALADDVCYHGVDVPQRAWIAARPDLFRSVYHGLDVVLYSFAPQR